MLKLKLGEFSFKTFAYVEKILDELEFIIALLVMFSL